MQSRQTLTATDIFKNIMVKIEKSFVCRVQSSSTVLLPIFLI
jgi:hypothetical protein